MMHEPIDSWVASPVSRLRAPTVMANTGEQCRPAGNPGTSHNRTVLDDGRCEQMFKVAGTTRRLRQFHTQPPIATAQLLANGNLVTRQAQKYRFVRNNTHNINAALCAIRRTTRSFRTCLTGDSRSARHQLFSRPSFLAADATNLGTRT